MKLFRNPYVVGVLAVGAALLVLRNAIGPMWQRLRPARQPVKTEEPAAAQPAEKLEGTATAPAQATKAPAVKPEAKIDLGEVGWKVNASPRRDPFQAFASGGATNRAYPTASEVLNLTAIWRQTGDSLAVINRKVVGEGDKVVATLNGKTAAGEETALTFTVESIETDVVWLQGPSGREVLEFKSLPAAPNRSSASLTNGVPVKGATAMR